MNMRVAFSNLFQAIAFVLRLFSFLLLFFINFDFDVVLPTKSSFNLASSFSAPSLALEIRSKISFNVVRVLSLYILAKMLHQFHLCFFLHFEFCCKNAASVSSLVFYILNFAAY